MKPYRDIILIVCAVALVVAILLPGGFNDETEDEKSAAEDKKTPVSKTTEIELDSDDDDGAGELDSLDLASPVMDVEHRLFPMVEGSEWKYLVMGPNEMIPDVSWHIRILKKPSKGMPGEIEVGFGEKSEKRAIVKDGDNILFGGLPFVAPRRFLGNRPVEMKGAFLPPYDTIVEGAVWEMEYKREVTYRDRNSRQEIVDVDAVAVQTDRAIVKKGGKVVVPAGAFDNAVRIDWLARLEMETRDGNRMVLRELTAEPFRKESIWLVPGIGMVKRRVIYRSRLKEDITFSLSSYRRMK